MRSTTPRSLALYLLLSASSLSFATAARAYEWPAGIDPSEKYWPPGTGPSKRSLQELAEAYEFELNQSSTKCQAVRKMSAENPAEKFYWDWEHEARSQQGFLGVAFEEENLEDVLVERSANAYRAPMGNLANDHGIIGVLLGKRQNFACAVGTYACTAIGVPGSCCAMDETCERIEDIGYGVVGCCPSGQECSGNLSGCGTGKKACSSEQGGGCCTDDYECSANGCIPAAGASETPTPASTCTSGYYACPTNVAGGCCPSGRLCGVSDCPTMTATGDGAAATGETCPTGYYTCAAQYNGGCCRIGRDCGITDCPERVVTISGGNGNAGAGGVVTTALANCASGWQTCGAALGGGCCPIGYQCGLTNCPAVTIGGSGYVLSGQTLTTPVVLSATDKSQPTAVNIPSANVGGRGKVTEVIVVVAVIVGVVANNV